MQIAAEQYDRGRFRVLAVSGELDIYSAPSLKNALVDVLDGISGTGAAQGLVLDLAGITFMDSAGLGVLVGAHRRARGAGVTMRLAGGSAQLLKLLTVTGVVRVMPPFPDVAAATA